MTTKWLKLIIRQGGVELRFDEDPLSFVWQTPEQCRNIAQRLLRAAEIGDIARQHIASMEPDAPADD